MACGAEAALAARGFIKLGDLGKMGALHRRRDKLCNAVATADGKNRIAQIG